MKKPIPKNAYESFLQQSLILKLYMPEGARLTLLKYTSGGNDLFAASVIIQEYKRLKWEREFLDKERRGFETWCRYMKNIPKRLVSILVSTAIKRIANDLYDEMYGWPSTEREWKNQEVISLRYLSYLLAHGMLMKCVRESEVSK